MGSPVSTIVANLYMEIFEQKSLEPAPHRLWFRYVDDTSVKIHQYHIDEFTEHINSQYPNIKFPTAPECDGKLPFLDTCIQYCAIETGRENKIPFHFPSGEFV